MKLYEFEGHKILARAGISSPFFVVVSNMEEVKQARRRLKFPIVAKVQVLSGGRGKGGGVKICTNEKILSAFCKDMLGSEFAGEQVRFIQLSEKAEIEEENYISITYDTVLKVPFMPTGTTGTFAHNASLATPVLPFWIFPVNVLVPSGYTTITALFLRYESATFRASSPLSLSIGI